MNRIGRLGKGVLATGAVLFVLEVATNSTPIKAIAMGLGLLLLCLVNVLAPWLLKQRLLAIRVPIEPVLVVGSICFSLLLGETILQVFYSHLFPEFKDEKNVAYRYDRQLGWFPIPNKRQLCGASRLVTSQHNSQGFRDAELVKSEKPGIVFLGDSFVWGFDVEAAERFTDKLQLKHPEWNVYNFGVSGFGTDQEYLLLQRHFETYSPRLVFLVFCTENDEEDNCYNARHGGYYKPYFTTNFGVLEVHGIPVPRAERALCAGHSLLSRSFLYRLLVRGYCTAFSPPLVRSDDPTTSLLKAMNEYVKARDAALVVGLTSSHPKLEKFLQEAKIPTLDLETSERYQEFGGHWTPQGHSIVCEKISQFLTQGNFLAEKLAQQRSEL